MMEDFIKQHIKKFVAWSESRGLRRRKMVKNASDKFIKCISYIAKKMLEGKYAFTSSQKQILRTHKRVIRMMVVKRTPVVKIRNALTRDRFPIAAILRPVIDLYDESSDEDEVSDEDEGSEDTSQGSQDTAYSGDSPSDEASQTLSEKTTENSTQN